MKWSGLLPVGAALVEVAWLVSASTRATANAEALAAKECRLKETERQIPEQGASQAF